jgi:hypothetical protein
MAKDDASPRPEGSQYIQGYGGPLDRAGSTFISLDAFQLGYQA